jgi:hypothetical protein
VGLAGRRNDLHEADYWGVLAGIDRRVRHPRGGKFSSLEILAIVSCELGCEVTGNVLCYVRSYLDVCNVHALAGNDFF